MCIENGKQADRTARSWLCHVWRIKKIKKDCTDLVCHVRRIKVPDLASAELVEDRQEVRHVFDQMVSADAISVHMCTLSCGGPDAKQRGTGC